MNVNRNITIISLLFILCIIISVLGSISLYGTLTRIESQTVVVNGNHYQNAEIAGFVGLIVRGYGNLMLLSQAPLQAVPGLISTYHEYLGNQMILVAGITACAIFGVIFCLTLLVLEIRKKT
ncbi:MAG: hypothetical protein ABFC24_05565 [Methanoregulaceae archaeon]